MRWKLDICRGSEGSCAWALVHDRANAQEKGDKKEEGRLHKEVRKQANRDKTQWLKDRLAESEQALDARQKWKWIKMIRSDRKPRPLSILGRDGKPTSRHLAHNQWGSWPNPFGCHREITQSQETLQHVASLLQTYRPPTAVEVQDTTQSPDHRVRHGISRPDPSRSPPNRSEPLQNEQNTCNLLHQGAGTTATNNHQSATA